MISNRHFVAFSTTTLTKGIPTVVYAHIARWRIHVPYMCIILKNNLQDTMYHFILLCKSNILCHNIIIIGGAFAGNTNVQMVHGILQDTLYHLGVHVHRKCSMCPHFKSTYVRHMRAMIPCVSMCACTMRPRAPSRVHLHTEMVHGILQDTLYHLHGIVT
jgi:hypothetical protein